MSRLETGSRDRIVDATVTLLRRGGLAASGVNQVVVEGNAPKGSLYHYFPNGKVQMVSEALERYCVAVSQKLRAALQGEDPPARRIRRLFRGLAKDMSADGFRSSCAVGAVTLDLGADDEALRSACEAALATWVAVIEDCLQDLPRAQRKPAALFLVTLLEGAQLTARAQRSDAAITAAEHAFLTYVEAVSHAR